MARWNGGLLAPWLAGVLLWPLSLVIRIYFHLLMGGSDPPSMRGVIFFVTWISPVAGWLLCVAAVALSNRTTRRKLALAFGSLGAIAGMMVVLYAVGLLCIFLCSFLGGI